MVLGGNGLPSVAGGFIPGGNQTMFEMEKLGDETFTANL